VTITELRKVKGMGDKKTRLFGDEILDIVLRFMAAS
jgi:hypothetical protein